MNTHTDQPAESIANFQFLSADGAAVELKECFNSEYLLLIFMRHLA